MQIALLIAIDFALVGGFAEAQEPGLCGRVWIDRSEQNISRSAKVDDDFGMEVTSPIGCSDAQDNCPAVYVTDSITPCSNLDAGGSQARGIHPIFRTERGADVLPETRIAGPMAGRHGALATPILRSVLSTRKSCRSLTRHGFCR